MFHEEKTKHTKSVYETNTNTPTEMFAFASVVVAAPFFIAVLYILSV